MVDLGSRWNGMARAYANLYNKMGVPTYALQLVLESPRLEWAMYSIVIHVKEMFLDGKSRCQAILPCRQLLPVKKK